ncbi:MAG: hypothetical protein GTN93_02740, partial [Anaerolineae bacterium]|nr:hypothetical protein [Anaerolineae bacterium]
DFELAMYGTADANEINDIILQQVNLEPDALRRQQATKLLSGFGVPREAQNSMFEQLDEGISPQAWVEGLFADTEVPDEVKADIWFTLNSVYGNLSI